MLKHSLLGMPFSLSLNVGIAEIAVFELGRESY